MWILVYYILACYVCVGGSTCWNGCRGCHTSLFLDLDSNVAFYMWSYEAVNQAISTMIKKNKPFKKIQACCLHPQHPRKTANKKRSPNFEKKMPLPKPRIQRLAKSSLWWTTTMCCQRPSTIRLPILRLLLDLVLFVRRLPKWHDLQMLANLPHLHPCLPKDSRLKMMKTRGVPNGGCLAFLIPSRA